MSYQCTNCDHVFSGRNAVCDDWHDKEKCFGCPACGTFLNLAAHSRRGWKYWLFFSTIVLAGNFALGAFLRSLSANVQILAGGMVMLMAIVIMIVVIRRAKPIRVAPF
jgi:hypothetical protein